MNEDRPPRATSQDAESADENVETSNGSAEERTPLRTRGDKKARKQTKTKKSGGGGALEKLPVVDGVQDTANDTLGNVTNTLGSVGNKALDQQEGGGGSGKSDTLRLRLDLNLDVEIQLKARIHGDLELALLN